MALRVRRDPHLGLIATCRYCGALILGTNSSRGPGTDRTIWTTHVEHTREDWIVCPKGPGTNDGTLVSAPEHLPEEVDFNDPADVEKWLGES